MKADEISEGTESGACNRAVAVRCGQSYAGKIDAGKVGEHKGKARAIARGNSEGGIAKGKNGEKKETSECPGLLQRWHSGRSYVRRIAYFPLKTGSRFSAKAVTASL